MVNSTLLSLKMDGTGQQKDFKEQNGLTGLDMVEMQVSKPHTCLFLQKQEPSSMRKLLKTSSSKQKAFLMDTITSYSDGLIPHLTTGHPSFLTNLFLLYSLFWNQLIPILLTSSLDKL